MGLGPLEGSKQKEKWDVKNIFFFAKQTNILDNRAKKKATAQANFYNLTWTPDPELRILDFIWYIFYQ